MRLYTFLGTGNYTDMNYYLENQHCSNIERDSSCEFIQIPLYNLLSEENKNREIEVIVFLTDKAIKDKNWIGGSDIKTGITTIGLKNMLIERKIKYKPVLIKSGENNDELWQNFNIIFEEFQQGEDVYVDITHSLRSIPIIFMAVLNYAVDIKDIHIHGIFYGAYDARHDVIIDGTKVNVAPIFNLGLFNELQEWTKGTEKFLTTGDARKLSDKILEIKKFLFKKNSELDINDVDHLQNIRDVEMIAKSLKTYSQDLLSSRGKYIVEDAQALKERLGTINLENLTELSPFIKVLGKVTERLDAFSGDVVKDCIYAVRECLRYQLIQQAYTIFQETITTALTIRMGINFKNKEHREIAENIRNYFNYGDSYSGPELGEVEKTYIDLAGEDFIKEMGSLSKDIGDFRNDLNHAGFSKNKDKIQITNFEKALNKAISRFEKILTKHKEIRDIAIDSIANENEKPKTALVILSHDLIEQQLNELRDTWGVGKIVNMPNELKDEWKQINHDGEIIKEDISKFQEFITSNSVPGDYIIIQGENGMTVALVNICFKLKRTPIYATTDRKANEIINGDEVLVTRSFKHVRFRKYIQ